jgi:guanylate kinase
VPSCRFSVSDTSRPKREGETDGVDYNFLTESEFRMRIDQERYAEWALVHGDYKGTPKSEIEKAIAEEKTVVLDIDVQGSEQIRNSFPDALAVFIAPPSLAELERRLRGRRTDDEEAIQKRLRNAMVELKRMFEFDYIVVNESLEEAIDRVMGILDIEGSRASRVELIDSLE